MRRLVCACVVRKLPKRQVFSRRGPNDVCCFCCWQDLQKLKNDIAPMKEKLEKYHGLPPVSQYQSQITTHLGDNYSKFSFGEVYHWIYGQKFSFTAVDFQTYICRYTSPNKKFEYGIPILMHFCSFISNFKHYKPHKAACHLTKCGVINDVKLFATVYRVIHSDIVLQKQVH